LATHYSRRDRRPIAAADGGLSWGPSGIVIRTDADYSQGGRMMRMPFNGLIMIFALRILTEVT
jgi:hypothetical protein